jgi:hypothetical protein
VVLPWSLWSRSATARIPGPLTDILGSYTPWWTERVAADPLGFLAALPAAAAGLAERILRITFPGVPLGMRWALALAALPLMGWGVWLLFRRSRVIALGVLCYAGLLWVWPFQDRRFLMPVIPLLFLLGGLSILDAMGRLGGAERLEHLRRSPGLARSAAVVAVAWAMAFSLVSARRLFTGWAAAGFDVRAEALANAVIAMEQTASVGQVMGAAELWASLHLYTGGAAVPSAPFRPSSVGARAFGTPEEQWAVWSAGGVQRLLVEHGGAVHGEALNGIEERCPGAVQILARLPGAFVVDLGRSQPCVADLLDGAWPG